MTEHQDEAAEQRASAARDPGRSRRRVRGAVRLMLQELFPHQDPDAVAEDLGLDALRGDDGSGLVPDESSDQASDAGREEESR
jgi:hypothetical protein